MKEDYGGQRRNMEDDTMVGTLHHQARIVWPLERQVFERRGGLRGARVLDLACGTGEILRRIRADFDPAFACGVDLFRGHLERAQGPVLQGDAYRLPFPDATFDLVLVRHVLQAVDRPVEFLRSALRVLRPGGEAHLLVEDYALLLFDIEERDPDYFAEVTPRFQERGTDLYQGRRAYRHVREAGFVDVRVDPVLVDTLQCDRESFAQVFRYWRDGYAATLAEILGRTEEDLRARFDRRIEAIRDPDRYSAWILFAVRARRPERANG